LLSVYVGLKELNIREQSDIACRLPDVRVIHLRYVVAQKHVNLVLLVLIRQVVVEVPLQRSKELEPTGALLRPDILLVRLGASILQGYYISQLLVHLRIGN
jgi:hypothetical protein